MQFLPSSGRVDTAIWMHYMDANKTLGEKAWRQLQKNAVSNIEQVQVAVPKKSASIRPFTTHHENHPSQLDQTCGTECWRSRDKLISDVLLWTPLKLVPTYSSSVPIRDVALKTYRKQWTVEKDGEKGSGISVLMTWHDKDEDIYIYIYIYIYICSLIVRAVTRFPIHWSQCILISFLPSFFLSNFARINQQFHYKHTHTHTHTHTHIYIYIYIYILKIFKNIWNFGYR